MTSAQRVWLVASLIVMGAVLTFTALEWDARPPRDTGFRVLSIYETNTTKPFPSDLPPPPPGFILDSGEWLRHGLFVRREWGPGALVWGVLLPLCLFAAAGFLALGRRRAGQ